MRKRWLSGPSGRLPRTVPSGARAGLAPWVGAGLLLGLLGGLVSQAPASWLAAAVASASDERLLLADARGTLWNGSAVALLTAGGGARGASALPGRLEWDLGRAAGSLLQFDLQLRQACCIDGSLRLKLSPGLGRLRIDLPPGRRTLGRWPAAWLAGLGAPFNTLQLSGTLRLSSDQLALESVGGHWSVAGTGELQVLALASPLTPLDSLGSYRLTLSGEGAGAPGARLALATLQGPLRLSGDGQWVGPRLRFRGQAQADAGTEAVLNNLLNLMGQRQGALALLAIG